MVSKKKMELYNLIFMKLQDASKTREQNADSFTETQLQDVYNILNFF